jgi:hypothetical protein
VLRREGWNPASGGREDNRAAGKVRDDADSGGPLSATSRGGGERAQRVGRPGPSLSGPTAATVLFLFFLLDLKMLYV